VDVDGAPTAIGQVMATHGLARCAVVPIQARGTFLGVVVAGFVDRSTADGDGGGGLVARLGGLADLAATALDNSELLERIRSQALHDALTGLPNRVLVEDR